MALPHGVVPRVDVVHLVVVPTHAVALRVACLRVEERRRVVDVVR